ncbi:protein kinase domain-containing protein [Streptomyces cucumeris]|uniref:protein kinase domain-containing protein n=1 Tax=Streptomyces cucumeris TaxID=2962890 RepID=UPI003D71D16A
MLRPLDEYAPRRIGPYRPLAALGSGGMGTVYLALPQDVPHRPPGELLSSLVAVKTLRQDRADDREFGIRFRREVEAARAVRGPHTVALVDADPAATPPWLATEYIVGPSLHEAVTRCGPLPAAAVRALGADLARGLRTIHGVRVLHRDLKPANVLLTADGPRIIDFGIAQAYDATALTGVGTMIGSPGFMAPEQLMTDGPVTAAADVFALGALLCFASRGSGPFHDEELAAVIHRVTRGEADLDGVPDELREAVAACLDRDPGARPTPDALLRSFDPEAAANGRPGRETRRTGPFPWPEGISGLIGSHDAQVRRVLEAAPPPSPGPTPPAVAPAASAPDGRRRPRSLVLALAGAAALTAGLLITTLLPGPWDGDETASDAAAPAPVTAGPVVTGRTDIGARAVGLGPHADDRKRRPAGWKPWHARLPDGTPSACQLADAYLMCGVPGGVEVRKAATGKRVWRYHDEGGRNDQSAGEFFPAIGGDVVYAAEGDGVVGLRLGTGKPVSHWPGAAGYVPTRAAAADGVVYIVYGGPAGVGTSASMLFRAYRASSGHRLWEKVHRSVFPQSMELVGDRLYAQGDTRGVALDTADGEATGEAPPCLPLVVRAGRVYCDTAENTTTVRDPRTLKTLSTLPGGMVTAGTGRTAVTRITGTDGTMTLRGVDLLTKGTRWTRPSGTGEVTVPVHGDGFLSVDHRGLRPFSGADGRPSGKSVRYPGWPVVKDPSEWIPPLVLGDGGVLYLVFDDGTVVSGAMP